MEYKIRPFHPSDLCSVYDICALTADCGNDASGSHEDPRILGHYFAGPYAVLESDLCFILTGDGRPCGYVLGTRDSKAFGLRCEEEWFPVLRELYPAPPAEDTSQYAGMKRCIHNGIHPSADVEAYPAHLHIDLLPCAIGQGYGRALMEVFLGRLRVLGIPAVHLGVLKKNERAIAYYEHMGFTRLTEQGWGFYMGLKLTS